jgi:hypothetical protein
MNIYYLGLPISFYIEVDGYYIIISTYVFASIKLSIFFQIFVLQRGNIIIQNVENVYINFFVKYIF